MAVKERLIFHVDVNSAFLSWESARRVANGEQDLRLIPAAIGGDQDKRTGVILAKSIPAKAFGVQTGEPVSMALRKCPKLILARPDFQLYRSCSHAFIEVCHSYAPVVEKASIDECFLDMTGTGRVYPDPVAIAHKIKDEIKKRFGFTVNVGIGNNKLLAKMASDFEKPDKVHTLFSSEIPAKLWPLPVGDLLTVGRSTAAKLERAGVHTIGALANMELSTVQGIIGIKWGKQLLDYARGLDGSPVRSVPEEAKGYSISTTLEEDVTTLDQAKQILLALADSVSARMRRDGAKAGCVAVSIRDNGFHTRSHQRTLEQPTDITGEVFSAAVELFRELWDQQTPLRLLGISLTELNKGEYVQQSLFQDANREKARQLDRAVDSLRGRFGTDIISRGTTVQSGLNVGRKFKTGKGHDQSDG